MTEKQTHFGYRDVSEGEKPELVRGVFSSVATRYDIMNDLMSGGVHRIWKTAMIDWLAPRPGWSMLDVAGGTGDIAFRILDRVNGRGGGGTTHVTVLDLTEDMLRAGMERAESRAFSDQLDWVNGDAMRLPFPDNSFDAYTIAFGIRNVTRVEEALSEAYRVLKPGGRFLCLEFSQVTVAGMDKVYDAYSFNVIPRIGQVVANDRDSYQYLVESIRQFPDQETFLGMIRDAGFDQARYRNMTAGVAALHSGWKL
jgi:demethylmenaquinone methyltransferase/2-methoxy-6-polyprenyl-1,4-benzoquinol methylase